MANKRENKLMCFENEVIKIESLEQAFQVAQKLNELGEKWCSGESYLDLTLFGNTNSFCLNILSGRQGFESSYKEKGFKIITATEWLNRWNIPVVGQEVFVREFAYKGWMPSNFVGICPGDRPRYSTSSGEFKFMRFKTISWKEEVKAREGDPEREKLKQELAEANKKLEEARVLVQQLVNKLND